MLRYDKIADSSSQFGFVQGQFVVMEKVHGAHFCVIVNMRNADVVQFAKRSGILEPGENFYGYLDTDLPFQAHQAARNAVPLVVDWYRGQQIPVESLANVRVHGELCGGKYPGRKSPAGIHPVQNGVWYSEDIKFLAYSEDIKFLAYDLAVELKVNENIEAQFLDYHVCREICTKSGFLFLDALFSGSLPECSAFNVHFQSTVAVKLGLPPLEDNLAEGVVIKACKEAKTGEARRILKRKIDRFSEKTYSMSKQQWQAQHAKQNTFPRGTPKATPVLAVETALLYEVLARVTSARYSAVVSKFGPNAAENVILDAFVADVLEDLDEDDRAAFEKCNAPCQQRMRARIREDASAFGQ